METNPAMAIAALPTIHTRRTTTPDRLKQSLAVGTHKRILPGTYIATNEPPPHDDPLEARRLTTIAAALSKRRADEILSHFSAATMWGMPTPTSDTRAHLTQIAGAVRKRKGVTLHGGQLDHADIEAHVGVQLTALARTAIDCAALLPAHAGLAAIDFAMSRGVSGQELLDARDRRQGTHMRKIRRLIEMGIATSDSAPESMTRFWMHQAGLKEVASQVHVRVKGKNYYLDCGVTEIKLGVEYDGRIKYEAPRALYQEKIREDAIRSIGWTFIRVTASDLRNPALLVARFRAVAAKLGYKF